MTSAPPADRAPVGSSAASASRVAPGRSRPSEKRIGARTGLLPSTSGRQADAPVASVHERHGGRPRPARLRGEDGQRHAGRVGHRIGTADPRRVLRREDREAEVLRRALLVAAHAHRGPAVRAVVAQVARAVAAAAGRCPERQHREDRSREDGREDA
jgi:hypothetical protein